MKSKLINIRSGQSVLEYSILIAVISAAVIAMFVYFQRSVNSRLEDLRQEYSPQAKN
jgi:Flp pilus assembly pilin Flp